MTTWPILSVVTFLPVFGAFLVYVLARGSDEAATVALGGLSGRIDDAMLDGVRAKRGDHNVDPNADLKARIHRACIDRLGTVEQRVTL